MCESLVMTPKLRTKKFKKIQRKSSQCVLTANKVLLYKPNILHCYLSYREILKFLEYTETKFSTFVKVHKLGNSYEHRPIKGIEIDWFNPKNFKLYRSKPDFNQISSNELTLQTRNIIFLEAGTHAREWITISVALNCIHQLTERNTTQRDVLRKLRFFIVPVVNPDGYEYSRAGNARWRKNRRPQKNSNVIGIDCNRNYDVDWEKGNEQKHRCTYKGEKPFSEPETRAVRNSLMVLANEILLLISLHSYAQCIMYPWGYTKKLPPNNTALMEVAAAGRIAIKKHDGRKYKIGNIAHLSKHTIPGSIVDYAFGALKIPLAIVMELPSKELGFQPPVNSINAIGEESWLGIRAMCICAHKLVRKDKSILLTDHSYIKESENTDNTQIITLSNTATVGIQCNMETKS